MESKTCINSGAHRIYPWHGGCRWLLPVLLGLIIAGATTIAGADDRIVLRNLTILSDRTVKSFDEDGVVLDNGDVLTWDGIEQARVASDQQEAFDRQLAKLGTPLYRIRQRLMVGDYEGLLSHAETLYPIYEGRQSETAYWVFQSLMWSYLAHDRREEALAPYLRCYGWLARHGIAPAAANLPGRRRLQLDPRTAFTPELLPVWFDADAARRSLEPVRAAIRDLPSVTADGIRIYFSTLASSAGEAELARAVLSDLRPSQELSQHLLVVAQAQQEILSLQPGSAFSRLERDWSRFSRPIQPLGLYWLGRGRLVRWGGGRSESGESGGLESQRLQETTVLDLLRIPAVYGEACPELAAAALYHSMTTLADAQQLEASVLVRRELLENYGQTWFAERVRRELSPQKDSNES